MTMDLDAVLARSRSPGKFVERRRFTLSRDRAIHKLREFSLRDPLQYILELVQGAVFADARWIAIDTSASGLTFGWCGGRGLGRADLEQLFDYLFVGRTRDDKRHVVQVAIAVNALLQQSPGLIRIESGDGTPRGTVRFDLGRKGEGEIGVAEGGLAGTYIHMRRRGRLLERFLDSTPVHHEEQGLVESRCLYCPVPILLNGNAPFGYGRDEPIRLHGVLHPTAIAGGGRRGMIGRPTGEGAPDAMGTFRMVIGGVWVETLSLDPLWRNGGAALTGVVADDGLRKTADQGGIVQDEAFYRMLEAVQPMAASIQERLLGRAWSPPPIRPDEQPVVTEARPSGARKTAGDADGAPGPQDAAGRADPTTDLDPMEPASAPGAEGDLLPDSFEQAAGRGALPRDSLAALPAATSVFMVAPEVGRSLETDLHPARFPHYVLLVDGEHATRLRREHPHLSWGEITHAVDAAFVAQAVTEADATIQSVTPWEDRGTLTLRLHLRAEVPGWGDPAEGRLPALIEVGTRSRVMRTSRIDLDVPYVSARFEHPLKAEMHGLRSTQWREAVRDALPLLAAAAVPETVSDDPVRRDRAKALVANVLGEHLVPWFVQEGAQTRLVLSLPGVKHPEGLLQAPLFRSRGRPVSVRDLARAATNGTGVRIDASTLPDWIGPLEARLGYGLIATETTARSIVAVMVLRDGRWESASPGALPDPDALLLIPAVRDADEADIGAALGPGYRRVESELGDVWAYERRSRRPGTAAPDWNAGLRELSASLLHRIGDGDRRLRARMRLAMLQIARVADAPSWRAVLSADPEILVDPTRIEGPVRAAAARGLPSTLRPTLPELRAIRAAEPDGLRILDDEPTAWSTLPSVQHDEPGWLVHTSEEFATFEVRLGLRDPFDDTGGLLLDDPMPGVVPWLPVPRTPPFHGLIRFRGASIGLDRLEEATLREAVFRLYDRLRTEAFSEARQATADAYLALDAREAVGESLGRPQDEATSHAVTDHGSGPPESVPVELERRLVQRLAYRSGVGPSHPMVLARGRGRLVQPWGGMGTALAKSHPIVVAALYGDERAIAMLSLEIARTASLRITAAESSQQDDGMMTRRQQAVLGTGRVPD